MGTSDHLSPLSHSHFKTLHLFRFSFSASQPFYLHLSLHFPNFSSLCFLLFFLSFSLPFLSFFPSPFLLFLTSVSHSLFCLSFFFLSLFVFFLFFFPLFPTCSFLTLSLSLSLLLLSLILSISLCHISFSSLLYLKHSLISASPSPFLLFLPFLYPSFFLHLSFPLHINFTPFLSLFVAAEKNFQTILLLLISSQHFETLTKVCLQNVLFVISAEFFIAGIL